MNLTEITQALEEFLTSDTDHLWLVDDRVLWEGKEDEFHHSFADCDADLIATVLRGFDEDPNWTWWAHLKAPEGDVLDSDRTAAFLALVRLSRRAVEIILQGIGEGWSGHPEALIPTLVKRAGLKIEDIGGTGSFTPPERMGVWYDKRTWHWRGPVEHVPGMLHFPLISRFHACPAVLAPEPQVAFLFLTRGELNHPRIWQEYLTAADQSVRVFAHTKDSSLLAEDSFLFDRQIGTKVETAWGDISLVHATLELLRAALEDEDTTHFVLVSESCIPVRPFKHLRVNLRWDERSRMRVWHLDEVRRSGNRDKAMRLEQLSDISKDLAFFQEQWMCLNREDALIVTERDWTPSFDRVYAADECYFATVLAAAGKPIPEAIANRPITWTEWRGGAHPREYREMMPRDVAQIAESGCFFARKFAPDSNIGEYQLHLH